MTVSLPMYDLGACAEANDALAAALGLGPLARDAAEALWADPELAFSHICGGPFQDEPGLRIVAVPDYAVDGCTPGHHRSFIIVNRDSPWTAMTALVRPHAVVNAPHSVTGRHLLGDSLAAAGVRAGRVSTSGSHTASLAAVARGEADVAAIDCISFHHLRREVPGDIARVRVLHATRATPCPPFVTRTEDPRALRERLERALADTPAAARTLALRGLHDGPVSYAITRAYAARADAVLPA